MLASAPTGNTSGEATIPASNIRLEAMRHTGSTQWVWRVRSLRSTGKTVTVRSR